MKKTCRYMFLTSSDSAKIRKLLHFHKLDLILSSIGLFIIGLYAYAVTLVDRDNFYFDQGEPSGY